MTNVLDLHVCMTIRPGNMAFGLKIASNNVSKMIFLYLKKYNLAKWMIDF